jgi:hypothetical protein
MWLLVKFLDDCVDRSADTGSFFVVSFVELGVSGVPDFGAECVECANGPVDVSVAYVGLEVFGPWMC